MLKKIETTLVRYVEEGDEGHGYMAFEGNMSKTFAAQILKTENQDNVIVITFQDRSIISFAIFDGEVGFRMEDGV